MITLEIELSALEHRAIETALLSHGLEDVTPAELIQGYLSYHLKGAYTPQERLASVSMENVVNSLGEFYQTVSKDAAEEEAEEIEVGHG